MEKRRGLALPLFFFGGSAFIIVVLMSVTVHPASVVYAERLFWAACGSLLVSFVWSLSELHGKLRKQKT